MCGLKLGPEVTTLASLVSLDLGSSSTVVSDPSGRILYDQPTLIAHDKRSGKVAAIGVAAKEVMGRVSGYVVVEQPIVDGRIASTHLMDLYLDALFKELPTRRFSRPIVVVGISAASTLVENRSLLASIKNVGVSDVHQVDLLVASAVGAGIDIYEPSGSMIVNLGACTTLSGILAFGGVVCESHAFWGGHALDRAIADMLRYRSDVAIDSSTAEEVKLALARVGEDPPVYVSTLFGRDLSHGVPVKVEVDEESVRDVIRDPIKRVVDVILDNLSDCPAELAQDLAVNGLHVCGGNSQVPGLAVEIARASHIPVYLCDEPRYCLARGLARYGKMMIR